MIKKLKAFFHVYKNSVFSPTYYKELLETNINFSIKYYLALVLFASILISTFETIVVTPQARYALDNFTSQSKSYFPEDLIIEIKDGDWTINKEQPFVIPMPDVQNESLPKNALVFYKEGTINDLEVFDTVVLVNSVNIIMKDSSGVQVRSLEGIPDTVVDRFAFENLTNFVSNVSNVLPLFIFVSTLFGLMIYYIFFRLTYSFGVGLVLYLLSFLVKDNSHPLDYIKSFRIALHTMTLPITIQVLLSLTRSSFTIPMWFFIINTLFGVYILFEFNKPGVSVKKGKNRN